MSIIYVGKVVSLDKESNTRTSEISYDGRTIGNFTMTGDKPGRFEISDKSEEKDLEEATKLALSLKSPSLQAHVSELFLASEAREISLRRMRNKLRKQTLFATPGHKVRAIASPYCERIRSRIKQQYPEAVILNTLSEDEAFRHYQAVVAA